MNVYRARSGCNEQERKAFARRLFDLLTSKRLSQSDLARQIWGETTDKNGHRAAIGKDRISAYLKGSVPDPRNLEALAAALGVTPEDLLPTASAAPVDRGAEPPGINMVSIPGRPNLVVFELHKIVTLEQATRMLAIVKESAE